MNINTIKNFVIGGKRFKQYFSPALRACFGTDGISEGVLFASGDREFVQQVKDATKKFNGGDWGTFYDYEDETDRPVNGREYGEYQTKFGYVWCERCSDTRTIIYFPFER